MEPLQEKKILLDQPNPPTAGQNGTSGPVSVPTNMTSKTQLTRTVHADDHLVRAADVAPAMHVSTTFRYPDDPELLVPEDRQMKEDLLAPEAHIYSRLTAPNTSRLEAVLSSILNGRALTYSSGLSAFHALLVYLNPKVIAIGDGYHGCHGVLSIMQKLTGVKKIDLHDVKAWDDAGLGKGDVVHVETPLNPTGEAYNLDYYAEEAHKRGAYLTVDATFGPPGLQDPFVQGADAVMHSGTKYIGGHSDMLCGILAVQREDWWWGLFAERVFLGSVMGSFEGWLGLRSTRTLELRVHRQSQNAESLVKWLHEALTNDSHTDHKAVSSVVERVQHASLQKDDMGWLKKQMPNGFGPVFALWMKKPDLGRCLPSKLALFHHATSLGGVESLIEWRRMSDKGVDKRLMRVSVGVEGIEDLKADLLQGFKALS